MEDEISSAKKMMGQVHVFRRRTVTFVGVLRPNKHLCPTYKIEEHVLRQTKPQA